MDSLIRINHLFIALLIGVGMVAATSANAAVIAQFNFDNSDGVNEIIDFTSSDPGTNWTTGDLTPQSGLPQAASDGVRSGGGTSTDGIWAFTGGSGRQVSYNSTYSLAIPGNVAKSNSIASAITNGDYFSFTISPDAGFEITLTRLDFLASSNNNNSDIPESVAIRINGSQVGSTLTMNEAALDDGGYDAQFILLPGAPVITSTTVIDIVILNLNNTGTTSERNTQYDDFIFTGDVSEVIPEPASAALLGLAGLALLRRRRRMS